MSTATQPGFPDRLNWRRFVAPGVIELADGAFLTAYDVTGTDQEYADDHTMNYLADQLNHDLSKLSSGWMLQAEACRVPVVIPPAQDHCPETTSQLVAEERAQEYARAGAHYETRLVYTFTWLPPSDVGQKFSNYFFGKRHVGKKPSRQVLLEIFQQQAEHSAAALGHFLKLHHLTDAELKRFLWYCVSGEDRTIGTAPEGDLLQYALGAIEVEPQKWIVNGQHTRCVGVYGFPAGTTAQMLDEIIRLPFAVRLSERFIFLGSGKAVKELEQLANTWGYYTWYKPSNVGWKQASNSTAIDPKSKEVYRVNTDAENQRESVEREKTKIQAGQARGGYYTPVVIVQDADEEKVEERAAQVVQILNRKGFQAVVETDNFEAWLGSLPGHGTSNVRKPRFTTDHLVRLLPTSSPWRGYDKHPSPLYPKESGPLLVCNSTGSTPFLFTPRLHTLVIGPTEAGKTTLFSAAAMAHLQYKRAQVFTIDNDAGGIIPGLACDGEYFDLDAMRFSPLSHIDEEHEYAWALDYCEGLAKRREHTLSDQGRIDLQRALTDLSKLPVSHRTMTGLLGQLQTSDAGLRAAIGYYAGSQPGSIIDGRYSETHDAEWLQFDMAQVRKRSEAVRVAVLVAHLHTLERRMSDQRPTVMMIDEGWMAAGEALLRDFMEEGSATMRKKVVSLWLVLHSPSDLDVFPHKGRLLNNIGTYIFLPNEMADTDAVRPHYEALGLGRREIKKIASEMVPRRDYYVVEGNQRRIFQLPWGPWHQALLGVNGRDHKAPALALRQQHGSLWLPEWLHEQGHENLAKQWETRNQMAPDRGAEQEAA